MKMLTCIDELVVSNAPVCDNRDVHAASFRRDSYLRLLSDSPPGPGCVNNSVGTHREGFLLPRKYIRQRTRFEVLKRDGFACIYCGHKAPAVKLVIDHIEPFSRGGPDDPSNYGTACSDCNAGKSAGVVLVDEDAEDMGFADDSEEAEILNLVYSDVFADRLRYIETVQHVRRVLHPLTGVRETGEYMDWLVETGAEALRVMWEEVKYGLLEDDE